MKPNERLQAFNILLSVVKHKSSLTQCMPPSAELSPWTKALCFGVCRHFFRLEALAYTLVDKKPKNIEIWLILLMGLYQLHYMRQADYAVIKETVGLLDCIKKTWAKGLVNAVLRNFCRQSTNLLAVLEHQPAWIYGQPAWLMSQLQKDWPDDWQHIAMANDAHPPMTLRVNKQKNTVSDYLAQLNQAAKAHPIAMDAITLDSPCDVHELPGFSEGLVSVQDAAAQLAASLLDLKPGLRLLDACCAPGGKTCHILETQTQLAFTLALDVDAKRLDLVRANLNRLNLQTELKQADALTPDLWWDGQLFDRILLDAPCSATGVIRRHPDIKLLREADDILTISQVQKQLLQALWPLLAPGGIMVYATCSLIRRENDESLRQFLSVHSDCQIIKINASWGRPTEFGRQILPGDEGMDGFFYSVLQKNKD